MSGRKKAQPTITAPDVTKQTGSKPEIGKQTQPQGSGGPTGDVYLDEGGPKDPNAIFTSAQRERVIGNFKDRCLAAEANYQNAAVQEKVDELLKKDDNELPWYASMMIDLAVGFVAGKVVESLVSLKAAQGAKIQTLYREAAGPLGQGDAPILNLSQKLQQASSKLSDKSVKTAVDQAFSVGKKQGVEKLKATKAGDGKDKKEQNVSFIDALMDAASLAFQKFRESTPGLVGDAELLLLYDSMDEQYHLISQYKTAIREKVRRFQESKVTEIGREMTTRGIYTEDGTRVGTPGYGGERVMRDVYVEWHTYLSGYPNDLVYRHHDSVDAVESIKADEPGRVQLPMKPSTRKKVTAEPGRGVSDDPKSKYVVPEEFREIALARHAKMWGGEPHWEFVDDSTHPDPARAKKARENRARQDDFKKQQDQKSATVDPGDPLGIPPTPANAKQPEPSVVRPLPDPDPAFGAEPKPPILPPSGPLGFGPNGNT